VITLTLLHPVQSTPVQSWSFEQDPAIRIGRAVDNHVVLYSAVVSRYHVEIRWTADQWEVVNLGTNGTYLDGKRVNQAPLVDGSIMRLARSGPNIQIHISGQSQSANEGGASTEQPIEELAETTEPQAGEVVEPTGVAATPATVSTNTSFYVSGRYPLFTPENVEAAALPDQPCAHVGMPPGTLICTDCGHPIHPLRTIGSYQVVKALNMAENTLMAWRSGHTVVLKTLRPEALENRTVVQQFEAQARLLCQLEHPGMPKFFEAFGQDDQPYLVSELVHGPNLRDWVSQHGPLSQYQVVQWGMELGRLLEYLHGCVPPYLHLHVRPSNLIRPRVPHGSGQVVLVGFGAVNKSSDPPQSGKLPIGYIAPEQQAGEAIPQSDLYALGTTLVYLLTGQEPDAFYRLGDHEQCFDLKGVSGINADMTILIQKLTHPDPNQRFESASSVVEALQVLL
jgi:eukaryotic-like serine/threonine-protein kinase